jgi:hypothetical protein
LSYDPSSEIYIRDFENGDWVAGDNEQGTTFDGALVIDFDPDDGQYYVVIPNTDSEGWWNGWVDHEVSQGRAPDRFAPPAEHVFLVGATKALTGVQVYADVATLVASYPNEGEHALEAVADPDEPVGKVRFAVVKGGERG